MAVDPNASANPSSVPVSINAFKGLNNRLDPVSLGLEWQLEATNALCTNAHFLVSAPSEEIITGITVKDAYGTRDGRLLAIDQTDRLIEVASFNEYEVRATGVHGAPFHWAEYANLLIVQSKSHQWVIAPNQVLPWGALNNSNSGEYPLAQAATYPPPSGETIAARGNQMMVAVWESDRDRSTIYYSVPNAPHEFRLEKDFTMFPGRITFLASCAQGVVIGTDRAIYWDAVGSPLQRVADYGVAQDSRVISDEDVIFFWTHRGLCVAPPFKNLTDDHLAVPAWQRATTGLLPWAGSLYAISQTYESGVLQQNAPYSPIRITTQYLNGIS